MNIPIYQVDAFTDTPFAGNPAAVCILTRLQSDSWMQNVAQEMNLSETAFLLKQEDGFSLRWFTPSVEVELCGHATLASAHILWEIGTLRESQQARFHTRSGLLTATRRNQEIELNFPATPEEPTEPPPGLQEALGASFIYIGKSRFDYLLEIGSEQTLRNLKPDFALLKPLSTRGVIVTAVSANPEFDFVSRFFGSGAGIDEDPVTGSAHCCLAPYWRKRLGKEEFMAYQASARGGVLRVSVESDRVLIAGQAVTVLRGELTAAGER